LAVLASVVAVVVLATHWPALGSRALFFDDAMYLTQNKLVRNPSWSGAGRFLREVTEPSTVRGYYQPLSMISLMLDRALGGRVDDLRPFRRTSLGFHVMNSVLVIVFLYLLFGNAWVAAMAGLLFGVHPLTVESVAWLSERKTMLAAFFALLCLVLYVRYTRRPGWGGYGACAGMYVLALMSKPISTPLPAVLLLLDYWPIRRLNRRTVLEKVPLFVIGGLFAIITVVSQARAASVQMPSQYAAVRIPLTLCRNIIFYLYKVIWPADLSVYYPFPKSLTLSDPMVFAGVVGTCVLVPVLLISVRWTRALLVGWLIFFVAIFPSMGVVGFSQFIAGARYVYLPSIGLLIALAWFLARLWGASSGRWPITGRQLGTLAGVLILAGSEAAATRAYLWHWQDKESLFRFMLTLDPNQPALHNGLGGALADQGEFDQAVWHFETALRLNPRGGVPRKNLAAVLVRQGRMVEALKQYERILQRRPDFSDMHCKVGAVLLNLGQVDRAVDHLAEALRLDPNVAEAHANLGVALGRLGKLDRAIEHLRRAVQLEPGLSVPRRNLCKVLAQTGAVDEAVDAYRRLLQIHPRDAEAHYRLGVLLDRQAKTEEARAAYREALRIDPGHAQARRALEGR